MYLTIITLPIKTFSSIRLNDCIFFFNPVRENFTTIAVYLGL